MGGVWDTEFTFMGPRRRGVDVRERRMVGWRVVSARRGVRRVGRIGREYESVVRRHRNRRRLTRRPVVVAAGVGILSAEMEIVGGRIHCGVRNR